MLGLINDDDNIVNEMKKDSYGDVPYADPGYQKDGVKRYPIDTEKHVRAAWSYINMPKNREFYTAEQLNKIETKIKSAAKKFDINISSDNLSMSELLTRGDGQGVSGPRQGDGGATICRCPSCRYWVLHNKGTPCNTLRCLRCGTPMIGE